jgi:hypothetical protein
MVRQGYINHVGLVLDASSSMSHLRKSTIEVADLQIKDLAQRSQQMDQETRATVYTFNERVDCVYYDKDVLRLPTIAEYYKPHGNTALIDATLKAISDLRATATLYGDHAFLIYVLTDGQENSSKKLAKTLQNELQTLPDNWTLAVFVPNQAGVFEAKKLGFAPGNIMVWDTTTEHGMQEVGRVISNTTQSYMTARSQGIRGTKGLFNIDTSHLTDHNIQSTLIPVPLDRYRVRTVPFVMQIATFVEEHMHIPYKKGNSFYQLSKPETVQASKQVMVRDNKTQVVYSGTQARQLLNLPGYDVRVDTADHPCYDIFIQSTSVNRKLVPGTEVITVV